MKNRYLKYFLFILMVVVSDQLIGTFIEHYAALQVRDNRIELLLKKEINSDIIILGSSRALNNYDPATITATTGLSCYNLGVSGSNILFHETLLDLIIADGNKPKIIIYNIDDYGTLFPMDGVVFRKDVLYPYVENKIIHHKICEHTNKNEVASTLMKTYRQNMNFINVIKYFVYGREAVDYKTTNFDANGANILVQRPTDPKPVFGTPTVFNAPSSPDSANANAFIRIQQKCADNNIQLILSLPPLYTNNTPRFKEMLLQQIMHPDKFIDNSGAMQEAKYFFNKDHMNREGALTFSKMVAEQISKLN